MKTDFRSFGKTKPEVMKEAFIKGTNPLISIDCVTWYASYTTSHPEKLNILKDRRDWQLLLFTWWGKWKSDVFELTEDDITILLS